MGRSRHLVRRFFQALRPGGPSEVDRVWVESVLSAEEYELWARQYPPDRRHSALTARRVEYELAGVAPVATTRLIEDTRWVLASALLHDIGKIESGFGIWGRVFTTAVAEIVGPERVSGRVGAGGCRGRMARYLNHPEIGAELLRNVHSDPRTVAWTAQHHQPSHRWTLPLEIAEMLHRFDND